MYTVSAGRKQVCQAPAAKIPCPSCTAAKYDSNKRLFISNRPAKSERQITLENAVMNNEQRTADQLYKKALKREYYIGL